eukprot:5000743-Prymnesium_polylepis.1
MCNLPVYLGRRPHDHHRQSDALQLEGEPAVVQNHSAPQDTRRTLHSRWLPALRASASTAVEFPISNAVRLPGDWQCRLHFRRLKPA